MRQVVPPLFPPLIEIAVAAPVEIANVADDKAIAIDARSDRARDIGCPIPVMRWSYRPPPRDE
jgi:hypothetical protein